MCIAEKIIGSDILKETVFYNNDAKNILHLPFRADEAIIIVGIEGYMKANLKIRDFILKKNFLLVILPRQVFEIKEISPDFRSIVFIMKPSFWDTNDSFPETMQLLQYFSRKNGIRLSEELMHEIITIYRLIKNRIGKKGFFCRQIIQYYIKIIFFNVYAFINEGNRHKATSGPPSREFVFEKFIQLVEQQF